MKTIVSKQAATNALHIALNLAIAFWAFAFAMAVALGIHGMTENNTGLIELFIWTAMGALPITFLLVTKLVLHTYAPRG